VHGRGRRSARVAHGGGGVGESERLNLEPKFRGDDAAESDSGSDSDRDGRTNSAARPRHHGQDEAILDDHMELLKTLNHEPRADLRKLAAEASKKQRANKPAVGGVVGEEGPVPSKRRRR